MIDERSIFISIEIPLLRYGALGTGHYGVYACMSSGGQMDISIPNLYRQWTYSRNIGRE